MKPYMIEVRDMQMCMKKNLYFLKLLREIIGLFVFSRYPIHIDLVSTTPPKPQHGF